MARAALRCGGYALGVNVRVACFHEPGCSPEVLEKVEAEVVAELRRLGYLNSDGWRSDETAAHGV